MPVSSFTRCSYGTKEARMVQKGSGGVQNGVFCPSEPRLRYPRVRDSEQKRSGLSDLVRFGQIWSNSGILEVGTLEMTYFRPIWDLLRCYWGWYGPGIRLYGRWSNPGVSRSRSEGSKRGSDLGSHSSSWGLWISLYLSALREVWQVAGILWEMLYHPKGHRQRAQVNTELHRSHPDIY